jgi:TolA-binding protein
MMPAANRHRPFVVLLFLVSIAFLGGTARAQSLAQLNRELDSIQPQMSAAMSNMSTASEVTSRLDAAEAAFAKIAAEGKANRNQIAATYQRLDDMLGSIYTTYKQKKSDCISKIDAGGQCDYNTPEEIELRALYPLSWLRFQGATSLYSTDSAKAKKLLNEAINGFTESTLVIVDPNLIRENLLGRAFCERELGKYDKTQYKNAIADFNQIIKAGPSTPQYRAAQQGLATTYAAMGEMDKAAQLTSQLAAGASGGQKSGMQMFRLQSLFKAEAAANNAAKKAQYRSEAVSLMKSMEGNKESWGVAIAAVKQYVHDPVAEFGHSSDPFEMWLLANVLYSKKDALGAAKYYLAAARTGKYPQGYKYAADIYYNNKRLDLFSQIINEMAAHPGSPDAQWASYERYKLPRMQWEESGMKNPKLESQWIAAAQDYIKRYPKGTYADEINFRLGERLQYQKKYAEAANYYKKVTGNSDWSFGAKFNQATCDYMALLEASKAAPKGPPSNIGQIRNETISLLDETIKMAPEALKRAGTPARKKYVHETTGAAIYMLAGLLEQEPKQNAARIASLLDGYESNYPSMSSHFKDVFQWRVAALTQLGKYAELEKQVSDFVERSKGTDENNDLIKVIGLNFWKDGEAKKAAGDENGFKQDAKLTLAAYKFFEQGVEQGKMQARNLTGTLSILGQAYIALGDVPKAKAIFDQVVKADPGSPDANAGLARIAQARKDYKDAVNLWTNVEATAAESDNLWYEAKYNLARIYLIQGNVAAACAKLAQTRAQHPSLGTPEIRARWDALQRKECLDRK